MFHMRVSHLRWVTNQIPRNQAQLEVEIKRVLTAVFWVALLAPVVIVPLHYLLFALVHLKGQTSILSASGHGV